MEEMIQMRDTFREAADIIDEFILIKAKEDAGEDVKRECESVLGRFMVRMMKLESLKATM